MPFIEKLNEILNNHEFKDIISWIDIDDKFEIKDENRLKKEVLQRFFKHDNIISFVRQLNLYGFKKVRNTKIFFHP
jgi:heat shock transcription factor